MHAILALTILAFCLVLASPPGVLPTAAAETARPVSAADLARDARRYLQQPITVRDVYCFAADGRTQCMTTEPLRIVLETMPAGPAKTAMDDECGELDGLEQSPACRFTLQMVPTDAKSETGTFVRNKRAMRGRITVVTATVISARKE